MTKEMPCRCDQESNIVKMKTEIFHFKEAVKTQNDNLKEKIDEIHHVLIDNGNLGLVSKHNQLNTKVANLVTAIETEKQVQDKNMKLYFGGSGLIGLVVISVTLLQAFGVI